MQNKYYVIILWIFVLFNFLPIHFYDSKFDDSIKNINMNTTKTKYILIVSLFDMEYYIGKGSTKFLNDKCPIYDCYVTNNESYFHDHVQFDAIIFHGPSVTNIGVDQKFIRRSPRQKFIFASYESSDNYPLYDYKVDGFFNWTWTYKLDSDARWGYVVVRDSQERVIGPSVNINWIPYVKLSNKTFIKSLDTKTKAAAWFVSNCQTISKRETYVFRLRRHLKHFGLDVDIFGKCTNRTCLSGEMKCFEMVERDYYFYLAFENSLSEDYVTEKIVNAIQHNTVPIVFGGANYKRFMPDGMYLNAMTMSPAVLAKTMHEIIDNTDRYIEFFWYKNHYTFHHRMETAETNDYCDICSLLHDEEKFNAVSIYHNLREWWNHYYLEKREVNRMVM